MFQLFGFPNLRPLQYLYRRFSLTEVCVDCKAWWKQTSCSSSTDTMICMFGISPPSGFHFTFPPIIIEDETNTLLSVMFQPADWEHGWSASILPFSSLFSNQLLAWGKWYIFWIKLKKEAKTNNFQLPPQQKQTKMFPENKWLEDILSYWK